MFDAIISPTLGFRPKPDPFIYEAGCDAIKVLPSKAIIFEDSPIGLQGASLTKCAVYKITKKDITINKMKNILLEIYQYRAINGTNIR
jgi:beta-phosphoglucomutase-like phosphatase (HAD superfamily)